MPINDECYICKMPFTSDDYKCDRIETTKSGKYSAHRECVDREMLKRWFSSIVPGEGQ